MTKITDLIDRWNTDEGKPYKGSLIDKASYEDGNLSCMCAQGQVLHVVGGWSTERLADTEQEDADKETANLLNISRAHAVLLRNINDSVDGAPAIVLTDPGAVLGDQWSKLLDFWWHMDTLGNKGWRKVIAAWAAAWAGAARDAARDAAGDAAWAAAWAAAGDAAGDAAWAAAWAGAARDAAWGAAGDAARAAAGDAAGDAAWAAAWDAAWAATGDAARYAARYAARAAARYAARYAALAAARYAAGEIQGAEILKRDGKPFFFLSMFGFASPDDIPARPTDYGVEAGEERWVN